MNAKPKDPTPPPPPQSKRAKPQPSAETEALRALRRLRQLNEQMGASTKAHEAKLDLVHTEINELYGSLSPAARAILAKLDGSDLTPAAPGKDSQ